MFYSMTILYIAVIMFKIVFVSVLAVCAMGMESKYILHLFDMHI